MHRTFLQIMVSPISVFLFLVMLKLILADAPACHSKLITLVCASLQYILYGSYIKYFTSYMLLYSYIYDSKAPIAALVMILTGYRPTICIGASVVMVTLFFLSYIGDDDTEHFIKFLIYGPTGKSLM